MNKHREVYTPEFKLKVVLEGLRNEKPIAQLCCEKPITDSLYDKWRDQFLAKAPEIFAESKQTVDAAVQAQVVDLERRVGKLALANASLKQRRAC